MAKKTYESYQKDYFQAMFGTRFPKRGRIKDALNRAHEIRQFEISLYWKRSLFFWGFVLTLFGVLGLMLTAKKPTSLTDFMPVVIAPLGFFTTCAWYYVEKGSKAWMANWELHIDYLEDGITGKLYKTRLWLNGKRYNFFSASKITQTVIFAFGVFWFLTSVFVTLNALLPDKLECFFCSATNFFEKWPWVGIVTSILLPFLIFKIVHFLAYRKRFRFLACWKKFCRFLACWKKIPACGKKILACLKSLRFRNFWKRFLACCNKCCLGGHWRTGDNKKFSDKKKSSDEGTVWFSQRERELKEAKTVQKN